MSSKKTTIAEPILTYQYQIHSCRSRDIYATVRLYTKEGFISQIHFLRASTLDEASKKDEANIYTLYYLKDELSDVIDLLRNEKPLFFVHDENQITRIATSIEPVGEGE